uniref:Membrane-bound transcription factor site-1 protease-like N-terminal domain-containing protein n=1 Tax=Eptatretus burgeri TaxID=7764 RepID=A0A8C4R2D8_EPTBU
MHLWLICRLLLANLLLSPGREMATGGNPEPPVLCANCTHVTVDMDFTSSMVSNEYIITFSGYYTARARASFISTALCSSPSYTWRLLPRANAASDFPSDFEVVWLANAYAGSGQRALQRHPSVRRVTPQRRVTRTLKLTEGTHRCVDVNILYLVCSKFLGKAITQSGTYWLIICILAYLQKSPTLMIVDLSHCTVPLLGRGPG